VKRTDGISTTDLVGRMLLCTRSHHQAGVGDGPDAEERELRRTPPMEAEQHAAPSQSLRYLTTTRKIVQFSNNRVPNPNDLVVYVDGSFDLFHIGHMRILEQAKTRGRELMAMVTGAPDSGEAQRQYSGVYLIVGIHEDHVVNEAKGRNYPIMNVNERVLGVLSCGWVDDVVMGVPYRVSREVLDSLGVHLVVAGGIREGTSQHGDPYEFPRSIRRFAEINSSCSITTDVLIQRIVEQHERFVARQKAKAVKDKASQQGKPAEYQNVREVA